MFDPDAVHNETNGQLVRENTTTDTVSILDDASSMTWSVTSTSRFYEDSGEEKLRLVHSLTANIFVDDTITFELAFRPASQPPPTDSAALGEDFVRCQLSSNSADPRYWQASLVDGYYQCSGSDASDVCLGADETLVNPVQEASSSWATPFSDESNGTADPWCTPVNTVNLALGDYWCSEIKCYMERLFDTGEDEFDYPFVSDSDTPDTIEIRATMAKLTIVGADNVSGTVTNGEAVSITVYAGAIATTASVAVALAAIVF